MNTGFQLFQLQEIDSTIDQHNLRIQEIETSLQNDHTTLSARTLVEEKEDLLKKVKSEFNRIDEETQSKKNKKSQSESSLYSGTIPSPKELQDLQKEIGFLTSAVSSLEDQLLEKLIEVEAVNQDLQNAQASLKIALSEFETRKALLNGEKNQLLKNIESQQDKKASLLRQIDPPILKTYESIRKAKNGVAVSQLMDNACSICGSSLTAGQCQQARSPGTLFFCPSCGRIVYGS